MTFQPAPECVEVAFHLATAGKPWTMVFHMDVQRSPLDSDLEDAAGVLKDWWDFTLHTDLSSDTSPVLITATDISQEGGHQYNEDVFGETAGEDGTPSLPVNTGAIMTWQTSQIGRSYRGRSFIAGISVSRITNNMLESDKADVLSADGTALIGSVSSAGFALSVLSRSHNLVVRSSAVMVPITNAVCRLYLGTQRRRLAI